MSVQLQSGRLQSGQLRTGRQGRQRSRGSIELRGISRTEWRVSDTSIPIGDAGSVLGFVERVADEDYEVLQLGHGYGIDRLTFRCLDDVVIYFARRD